jgi:hypothetical protein
MDSAEEDPEYPSFSLTLEPGAQRDEFDSIEWSTRDTNCIIELIGSTGHIRKFPLRSHQ